MSQESTKNIHCTKKWSFRQVQVFAKFSPRGCLCVFYFLFLFFLFLHFLDYLFCYAFETDLRFIYYILEKSRSFQKPPNIWDCAVCDII